MSVFRLICQRHVAPSAINESVHSLHFIAVNSGLPAILFPLRSALYSLDVARVFALPFFFTTILPLWVKCMCKRTCFAVKTVHLCMWLLLHTELHVV